MAISGVGVRELPETHTFDFIGCALLIGLMSECSSDLQSEFYFGTFVGLYFFWIVGGPYRTIAKEDR